MQVGLRAGLAETVLRIELKDAHSLAQRAIDMKGDERKSCLLRGGEKRLAERIERRVSLKRDRLTHLLIIKVCVARTLAFTS